MNSGHFLLLLSVVFFIVASYATLLSAFLPLTGIFVRLLHRGVTTPLIEM
jgi:hypothetical protein